MEVIHLRQITLRGIPVEIERMIKREAERKGLATGTKNNLHKRKSLHHDLDHLSGIWTKREAEEFIKNIRFQRSIDENLWKNTKS